MVKLDDRDRMAVAWLIQNAGGQDRNGGRMVDSLELCLSLPGLPPSMDMRKKPEDGGKPFELDARQRDWITDQIDAHFKDKTAPPLMCPAFLALEKVLRLEPEGAAEEEGKP